MMMDVESLLRRARANIVQSYTLCRSCLQTADGTYRVCELHAGHDGDHRRGLTLWDKTYVSLHPTMEHPAEKAAREYKTACAPAQTGGNQAYLKLLDDMRELHLKKAADYGTDKDPLANLRASAEFGVPPWRAAVIRFGDKVSRLKTFCQKGTLANEGVEDTLKDAAAYALLALTLFLEEQNAKA